MSTNQQKEWDLFNTVRDFFFDGILRAIPPQDPKDIKFVTASPEEMERARRLVEVVYHNGVPVCANGVCLTEDCIVHPEAQEIIRNQE